MRISDWSSDVCSSDLAVKADLDAGDSGFLQAREKRQSRPSRPRYRSWTTSCRKEPTTIRWLQPTGARLSSDGRRQRRSGAGAKTDRALVGPGRSVLRIGTEGPAAIDNGDPPSLGLDHQAFEYAIARKRDDVARIEGEHPLVTLEAGTGAQPHVERERALRDAATFSPARCQTVDALGVAAMAEHHVRAAVADIVRGGPNIVAVGQRHDGRA